jgi:sigma-B regulation protein RsbU (phosphoserine phosphatase)
MTDETTGPGKTRELLRADGRPRVVDVLLIEDDPDDVLLIREMLHEAEGLRFRVAEAGRLSAAQEILSAESFDVVLMDLGLPDSQGLDSFEAVHAAAGDLPIVVLTGLDDESVGLDAVQRGAQDYLVKGHVNAGLLARSACYAVERAHLEAKLKQALGELDREFRIVADLQASFLPSHVPDVPGFEIAVYYRPAERAGGDYFDFLALPGDCTGVLIADVSGHGAPAAVVMAMARLLVHTAGVLTPPGKVLGQLNDKLVQNIPRNQFVTACYGVLDPVDRTFTFSLAGHAAPLMLNPAAGTVTTAEPEPGPALGIVGGGDYPACCLRLDGGSVLVLYTDGITECRSPSGQQFGEARLCALLGECAGQDAQGVRQAILSALQDHCSPGRPEDDTTFVVIRARPQTVPDAE